MFTFFCSMNFQSCHSNESISVVLPGAEFQYYHVSPPAHGELSSQDHVKRQYWWTNVTASKWQVSNSVYSNKRHLARKCSLESKKHELDCIFPLLVKTKSTLAETWLNYLMKIMIWIFTWSQAVTTGAFKIPD